ncbi:DUF2892 domain-containing protein [Motiliproteus sp. MSK22-1]|uniref:YgaP family membrane protein n=1 Tax=Motiliproteus sp. MSK22-1 TaxID=1897630 RepID=UPI0035164A45
MGLADRLLRTALGTVLVVVSWMFLDVVPGPLLSNFCLYFGLLNILSSLICWCFMYSLVGISSRKEQSNEE